MLIVPQFLPSGQSAGLIIESSEELRATVSNLDDPAHRCSFNSWQLQLSTSHSLCLACTISSLILRRSLSELVAYEMNHHRWIKRALLE